MNKIKKYLFSLLALPVLLGVYSIFSVVSLAGGEEITPADCIVVFGAKLLANGEPSTGLIERTETGINLFNSGYADYLIFTGGVTSTNKSESEAMKRLALRAGIDESKIITETQSLNTEQNIEYSLSKMEEISCKKAIFVSHYYHLGRIELVANRNGFDPIVYPAQTESTLMDKKLLFQEFFKYGFTWLFYFG